MICPRCGKNNSNNLTVCIQCGSPLPKQMTQNPQPTLAQPQVQTQQRTQTPAQVQHQPSMQLPQPNITPMQTMPQVTLPASQYPTQYQTPEMVQLQPQPQPMIVGPPQQPAKPTSGICSVCERNSLEFYDNGMGRCLFCGRTFDWRNPSQRRGSGIDKSKSKEKNPFIVTEDEILDESERKAEVDAEEIIHHETGSSVIIGRGKDSGKSKKSDMDGLTDEKRLQMLEDRFLTGDVSEATYLKLKEKFVVNIMKTLEDKLVTGEISEKEYQELLDEINK